ncbi:MAG: hypothetical protein IJQ58_05695 [Synergistaceae bacterium]|nr:hypothetical protein [Synergistaceae bacterium]
MAVDTAWPWIRSEGIMPYIIGRSDPERQFLNDRAMALAYTEKNALKSEGISSFTGEHKFFRWIKTELSYPSFDDFTFGYKNQIFSVMVLRATEKGILINPRPRIEALRRECSSNNLIPCVFPVHCVTGKPFFPGTWNLVDPFAKKAVDPAAMSSDDDIEMSDWELRNWAVQVVYEHLKREGLERLSFSDAPGIDPQIWFRDSDGKECWLEVLYARYPDDAENMSFSCSGWPCEVLCHNGYIARVGFAGAEDMSRLFRTKGAYVKFRGIEIFHRA